MRSPRGEVHPLTLLHTSLDGRVYVGWSSAYDKQEHFGIENQAERVEAYCESVRPGDIILMHDGNTHGRQMVSDLPLIVDGLKARGYRFSTLDELRRPAPWRAGLASSLLAAVRLTASAEQ